MPRGSQVASRTHSLRFSAPKGVERACPSTQGYSGVAYCYSFSAPKGVERACPRGSTIMAKQLTQCFSAPKGVERACPWRVCPAGARRRMFQCPEGR